MSQPAISADLPATDVQRLWFATLKKEWNSLAVLPAHPGGTAGQIGKALAKVASLQKDSSIKLISAEGTDLAGASDSIPAALRPTHQAKCAN